jgi:geranylgeranyl pyrophosphate synthase
MSVPAFLGGYQRPVHAEMARLLDTGHSAVERAMAYTALAPSKQVRAALVLLSAELCRGSAAGAVPAAAAIELVHASSLILDDLPSMDDAPLRRGRRASHLEFGEPVAILAAFGLLNLAYGSIARAYDPPLAAAMTTRISDAVGPSGLIGGQALDLEVTLREPQGRAVQRHGTTDLPIDFETLERIHRGKTGALFVAAAACGALAAGAVAEAIAALSAYAKNLGLAFQIVDDLLDVAGDPAVTGKAVRADARKTTFVSFSGVDGARQLAAELCETADRALAPFGAKADRLRELSQFVAARRM